MYSGEVTDKIIELMGKYEEKFKDCVPLMEIPGSIDTDQLESIIEKSLKEGKLIENYIPEIKEFEEMGVLL